MPPDDVGQGFTIFTQISLRRTCGGPQMCDHYIVRIMDFASVRRGRKLHVFDYIHMTKEMLRWHIDSGVIEDSIRG